MLDNDSYFETCHNHCSNAMLMHIPNWLKSVHLNRRFVMVTMVLGGTFDVWPALRVLHKIVAVNHYCWAFDIDQLVLLHPLNKLVVLNDVMRKRVNHLNVMAIQPMLLERKRREK